jgi:hypothetical protein
VRLASAAARRAAGTLRARDGVDVFLMLLPALPDLRDAAPSFLRPLIRRDWRRSIAGAATVYIPIPGFSF